MSAAPLRRFEAVFIRPYRFTLLVALVGVLLQSLLTLPIPIVQGRLFDRLFAGAPNALVEPFWIAVVVTVVCLFGRALLAWCVGIVMTRVSLEVVKELTAALHRKIRRQSLVFLDRHQTGELLARLTNDVGSLMIFLNTGTLQLVSDLVLAVGIAGVLLWLNWPLALVALAALPLVALGHTQFAEPLRHRAEDVRTAVTDLYALLSERLPAIRVVRTFNQENAELDRLTGYLDAHADAALRGLRLNALQTAATLTLGGLGSAAVVIVGAWLATVGRLSPGDLLTFYTLTALLYAPMVRLAQFQGGWAAVCMAVAQMSSLLDQPDPSTGEQIVPSNSVRGALEVCDLTFGYRPDVPPVLSSIGLRVEAGHTLGVIGPTGAGKSTLLSLLVNLYNPGPGRVFVDGTDVTAWEPADLRRAVVLVPQRPILFEGTIRSNLTYAAPDTPEFRLWQILKAVELANVVQNRPGGLDSSLGPGGLGLSGGQRQRLALARAILANPAVLLLDDCTSALDPETEVKVQANLAVLLPNVTRVIVSHKLAAVRLAEEIVVLESGRIVDRGSYSELLGRRGWGADLVSVGRLERST